jgi:hypothetical protein
MAIYSSEERIPQMSKTFVNKTFPESPVEYEIVVGILFLFYSYH